MSVPIKQTKYFLYINPANQSSSLMSHLLEQNAEQQNEYMQIHTKLSDIYAEIEGQLCSKQSTSMNKLKNQFQQLYADLLPSHYVIVNHMLSLPDFSCFKSITGKQVKMASENGIILLVKQTYLGDKIFINGINEQQLIYEAKGKICKEETNQLSQYNNLGTDIEKTIILANDSLTLNKLYGATILAYSTVSENTLHYKEKLLLAVFLAILIVNEQLQQLTIDQIYQKLLQSQIFSTQFLETQFMPFKQGQLLLTERFNNEETQSEQIKIESFKIPKKQKLLFLDLNLEQKHLQTMKKKCSSITEPINKTQNSVLQQFNEFITTKSHQVQNGFICLSEYIRLINQQITKNPNMKILLEGADEQAKKDIEEVLKEMGKDYTQCVLSSSHLVFCLKPHQIHEKIRVLRKFISNRLSENPEIISSRHRANGVDKMIFSSSPSLAISIFNPENQIWFK